MNIWYEMQKWHTDSGCTEEVKGWRDELRAGWWLSHGGGEARVFWDDRDLYTLDRGRTMAEWDVNTLAAAVEWLNRVHEYEAARA